MEESVRKVKDVIVVVEREDVNVKERMDVVVERRRVVEESVRKVKDVVVKGKENARKKGVARRMEMSVNVERSVSERREDVERVAIRSKLRESVWLV